MTLKERFKLIKAAFDGTPPAPANPPAPTPAAPAPGGTTSCGYPVDGGSPVYVDISDDGIADIDTNDKVYTDSAMTIPYPDGTYKVTGTDFSFTVAGGIVTAVIDADGKGPGTPLADPSAMAKPPVPAPTPAPAPAPAPPQPVTLSAMTPEQMSAIYSKFAGGIDDQIGALIIMVKALMEANFGWKIREGNENQAIQVYKDTIGTSALPVGPSMDEMSAVFAKAEKFDAQAKIIAKHEETIKGLFDLLEKLVDIPGADPKTLTGVKKEKFEKEKKREEYFEGIANSLKNLKSQK